MAKREFPLFIIDKGRTHKMGECDFIVCTDQENGFIGKCEYVENQPSSMTDDSITIQGTGIDKSISLKMSIKRMIGKNPTSSATRTLMRKAMDVYNEDKLEVRVKPSNEDCKRFLEELIRGNRHYIQEAGVNVNERNVILTSIHMLESIKNKL